MLSSFMNNLQNLDLVCDPVKLVEVPTILFDELLTLFSGLRLDTRHAKAAGALGRFRENRFGAIGILTRNSHSSSRVQLDGRFEALEVVVLNASHRQCWRESVIDSLRQQNLAGGCGRLCPGRGVDDRADCGEVAM